MATLRAIARIVVLAAGLMSCAEQLSAGTAPGAQEPIGVAVQLVVDEDTPAQVLLTGIDAQDAEAQLTVAVTRPPIHGRLSPGAGPAPLAATYLPDANYVGPDEMAFVITDAGGHASAPVTIPVEVRAVNDAPVAAPLALVATLESTPVDLVLTGLDVEDGTDLEVLVRRSPAGGALDLLGGPAPLAVRYTPGPQFHGPDTLEFVVIDRQLIASAPVVVRFEVEAVDDPPAALDLEIALDEDGATTFAIGGSDPEGGALWITSISPAARGSIDPIETGALPKPSPVWVQYQPRGHFFGADAFRFTVSDGLSSATAEVRIAVRSVNDAPVAFASPGGLAEGLEDQPLALPALTGLDVEDALTDLRVEILDPPAHGTLNALAGAAPLRLVYTPHPNYTGGDVLRFLVTDTEQSESGVQELRIVIAAENDAPVAIPRTVIVDEDAASDLLLAGSDADGDSLDVVAVASGPAHGQLLDTTGQPLSLPAPAPLIVRYVPRPDYHGTDLFEFALTDGTLFSQPAAMRITVRSVNDLPTLAPIAYQFADAMRPFLFEPESSDLEGDTLSFSMGGAPLPAWARLDPATGIISGTPGLGAIAVTPLILSARDGGGVPVSQPFTLEVGVTPPWVDFFDIPNYAEIGAPVEATWGISEGFPTKVMLDPLGDVTQVTRALFTPFPVRPPGVSASLLSKLTATNAAAPEEALGVRSGYVLESTGGAHATAVGQYYDGSYVVTGWFRGAARFGPGDAGLLRSAGGQDIFVVHYRPDGTVIFASRAGGPGDDEPLTCSKLSLERFNTGVLVAGRFQATAIFGAGETYETRLVSAGGDDAFVAKFDHYGQLRAARRLGGPGADRALSVTRGFFGDVFVTGSFEGVASVEGGASITSAGGRDLFLSRYDGSMRLDRTRTAGGTGDDEGTTVIEVIDGGVFLLGNFSGTALIAPGFTLVAAGLTDLFAARFDYLGGLLWAKRAGGPGEDRGASMVHRLDDTLALTGRFQGSAVFGAGESSEVTLSAQGVDAFVARLDGFDGGLIVARAAGHGKAAGVQITSMPLTSMTVLATDNPDSESGSTVLTHYRIDGTEIWRKVLTATGGTAPAGISTLRGTPALVVGSMWGDLPLEASRGRRTVLSTSSRNVLVAQLDSANSRYATVYPMGMDWVRRPENAPVRPQARVATFRDGSSLFLGPGGLFRLAKYDVDGNFLWARAAESADGGSAAALATFSDDSALVAGGFSGQATFGPGESNEQRLTAESGTDLFVARYDEQGRLAWVRTAPSAHATSISASPDGTLLVGGSFQGTTRLAGTTLTSAGGADFLVARYDATGSLIWARRAGGPGRDRVASVAVLHDGTYGALGSFEGVADFGDGASLISLGLADIALARYDSEGKIEWVEQVGGPGNEEARAMIALHPSSMVVTGTFSGDISMGLVGHGYRAFAGSGNDDALLARYGPTGLVYWAQRIGGPGADRSEGLVEMVDSSVVVVGRFQDRAVFAGGSPVETALVSAGGDDAFFASYSDEGVFGWAKRAGGALDDAALSAGSIVDRSIVVAGAAGWSIPGTPSNVIFGPGEANQQTLAATRGFSFLAHVYNYPDASTSE